LTTERTDTVLLLPGWQNSGEGHWQTHWERQHGYLRVDQNDWLWPRRGDWMARLEETILAADTPCWLVAHSLGCQLAASWAAHSRHAGRVRGALLVAPPDTERADMPPQVALWRPMSREALPFAATVVVSTDDPFCAFDRSAEMAQRWNAMLVSVGAAGHLNADSGLGDWPVGHELLCRLMDR
jgi:hypothetical protein